MPLRATARKPDELRPIILTPGFAKHAEGSCLVKCGDTHVLVTASIDDKVPPFMRGQGLGWVTAEYGMLPRATHERSDREAAKGKQGGRTLEIQRLIGRALRAVVDRKALGEVQIKIDCDVLQADGGTRTASITGAYVALVHACKHLQKQGRLKAWPLTDSVAAISCGIYANTPVLDLDYAEDSHAMADANFVLTGSGALVEIQATAEMRAFSDSEFNALLELARKGLAEISLLQKQACA